MVSPGLRQVGATGGLLCLLHLKEVRSDSEKLLLLLMH